MPLRRLLPAVLLCLLAFPASAEEPTAPAPEPSAAAPTADESAPADGATQAVPESGAPAEAAPPDGATAESGAPVEAAPSEDATTTPPAVAEPTEPGIAPQADTPSGVTEDKVPTERPRVDIQMPVKGMTMSEVEAAFGAPPTRLPAVGKPPITRWVYADYTVYFEYSEVLHVVLNQSRPRQP